MTVIPPSRSMFNQTGHSLHQKQILAPQITEKFQAILFLFVLFLFFDFRKNVGLVTTHLFLILPQKTLPIPSVQDKSDAI